MADSKQCKTCGAEIPRDTPWFGTRKHCTNCTAQKPRAQAATGRAVVCEVEGCEKRVTYRQHGDLCAAHYAKFCRNGHPSLPLLIWRSCSLCSRPFYTKGRCRQHYYQVFRQRPEQQARSKAWRQGAGREKRRAVDQKRRQTEKYKDYQRGYQEAHKDWGAWWEGQRLREDRADLRAFVEERGLPSPSRIVQGKAARPRTAPRTAPRVREFIMGVCIDCGESFTVIRGWWHGSRRCSRCTQRHWGCGDHLLRARKYGVEYEPIEPTEIFERDGYRCQICKLKTRGTYPNRRSPSLDHIVPLSQGGGHVRSNVQCACWDCNTKKGNRSALDQLRLAI